ncbi:MAG: hypothetical protein ACRDNW_16520 [Trebonia sp.]
MTQTKEQGSIGVEPDGRWKPSYMTDGELIRELATETDRRADLEAELRERRVAREAVRGPLREIVPIGNRGAASPHTRRCPGRQA